MREIKLLKFADVPEYIFVAVASEGVLKKVLSKEEWDVIKDWKEVVLMEKSYFVINRFLQATATTNKHEKRI